LVCLGVLALRLRDPNRPRPFKVPFIWPVALGGAAACLFVMKGLPVSAWYAFGIWMTLGLMCYFAYGYRNSVLRNPGNRVDPID
ncbi:MAG: amino acid permease C-terminal domain-containing protein, partial [Gemmatimonas sp.]